MDGTKNEHQCKKCNGLFTYEQSEIIFDDKGYGYSTKLVKCKHCGCLNVLKHYEDKAMRLNNDSRFYKYSRNRSEKK